MRMPTPDGKPEQRLDWALGISRQETDPIGGIPVGLKGIKLIS